MRYEEIIYESVLVSDEFPLFEAATDRLKSMVDSGLTKPYKASLDQIKKDLVSQFAPKLKNWAEMTVQTQAVALSREEVALLTKVIANSEQVTLELLRSIESNNKVKTHAGKVKLHFPAFTQALKMFMKD